MSTSTISKTFSATGSGPALFVRPGETLSYSGTVASGEEFTGRAVCQRSTNGGQTWQTVVAATSVTDSTGVTGTTIAGPAGEHFRWAVESFTGQNLVTSLVAVTSLPLATARLVNGEIQNADGTVLLRVTEQGIETGGLFSPTSVNRTSQTRIFTSPAKAGTTAGWVVGAADNLGKIATLPASQTGSTLVIRLGGFKVGDVITSFSITGSIQSAGNTATLTADLRSLTAAVAGATDASVGAMAAPLSVTANTIVSAANAVKTGLSHTVIAGESFYVLITSTTAASTTQEIQSVNVTVTES